MGSLVLGIGGNLSTIPVGTANPDIPSRILDEIFCYSGCHCNDCALFEYSTVKQSAPRIERGV